MSRSLRIATENGEFSQSKSSFIAQANVLLPLGWEMKQSRQHCIGNAVEKKSSLLFLRRFPTKLMRFLFHFCRCSTTFQSKQSNEFHNCIFRPRAATEAFHLHRAVYGIVQHPSRFLLCVLFLARTSSQTKPPEMNDPYGW